MENNGHTVAARVRGDCISSWRSKFQYRSVMLLCTEVAIEYGTETVEHGKGTWFTVKLELQFCTLHHLSFSSYDLDWELVAGLSLGGREELAL